MNFFEWSGANILKEQVKTSQKFVRTFSFNGFSVCSLLFMLQIFAEGINE